MDKGPWSVLARHLVVSDDFNHDVTLEVTGDFATADDQFAYCEWLAGVLNTASKEYMSNIPLKECAAESETEPRDLIHSLTMPQTVGYSVDGTGALNWIDFRGARVVIKRGRGNQWVATVSFPAGLDLIGDAPVLEIKGKVGIFIEPKIE